MDGSQNSRVLEPQICEVRGLAADHPQEDLAKFV